MIKHHFSDGVYAKEQRLGKGYMVETHAHKYDHLSIMCGGPVEVDCDGISTMYVDHACITIKAGVKHKITALGDSVWFCIHKVSDDLVDFEKIDELLIVQSSEPRP